MKLRAIAAALLLLSGAALAQEAENPVTRVLVLGDAIGGGLGAGLTRVAEPSGEYEVSNRFNEQSGLARPEVYDWTATVPKILGSNAYDVIVVVLGANDTQPIRQEGGVRIPPARRNGRKPMRPAWMACSPNSPRPARASSWSGRHPCAIRNMMRR
jgi:hypothetical protein